MSIIGHHLNNSRSQRILWLLEELAVPYDIRLYRRDPVSRLAPAALKKIHPLGKSPVITDGRHTVAETGAIVEYLIERHGEGRLAPGSFSLDTYIIGTPDEVAAAAWHLCSPEASYVTGHALDVNGGSWMN